MLICVAQELNTQDLTFLPVSAYPPWQSQVFFGPNYDVLVEFTVNNSRTDLPFSLL